MRTAEGGKSRVGSQHDTQQIDLSMCMCLISVDTTQEDIAVDELREQV